MLKYSISSLFIVLMSFSAVTQNDSIVNDSIKRYQKYGLRLGGDLSKIIKTAIDDDYTGFEINADFRYSKNIYIAGEIGAEEKTTITNFLSSTAKGSYFKAGIDYNMYENWFGMENMIYTGFRVGFSTFSQTINSYTIFNTDKTQPETTITQAIEHKGLTAVWTEIVFGIKAEVLNNFYVGINVQLKRLIKEKIPNNFQNIYIPGFNRTYDSGSFGLGFGYSVSYLIPLLKK